MKYLITLLIFCSITSAFSYNPYDEGKFEDEVLNFGDHKGRIDKIKVGTWLILDSNTVSGASYAYQNSGYQAAHQYSCDLHGPMVARVDDVKVVTEKNLKLYVFRISMEYRSAKDEQRKNSDECVNGKYYRILRYSLR